MLITELKVGDVFSVDNFTWFTVKKAPQEFEIIGREYLEQFPTLYNRVLIKTEEKSDVTFYSGQEVFIKQKKDKKNKKGTK